MQVSPATPHIHSYELRDSAVSNQLPVPVSSCFSDVTGLVSDWGQAWLCWHS